MLSSCHIAVRGSRVTWSILLAGILLTCSNPSGIDLRVKYPYVFTDKMLSWSPDGAEIAYVTGGNSVLGVRPGIYLVDLQTRERRFVCSGGGTICHTDWRPDGRRIVFSMYRSIYTIAVDGSDLRQLTSGNEDTFPQYSPDGMTIVFTREDGGTPGGIYSIPDTGGTVTRWRESGYFPDWFPDGQRISLLAHDAQGKLQYAILHIKEDSLQFLTTEAEKDWGMQRYAFVSPSGREVTFSADEKGIKPSSLYTIRLDSIPIVVTLLRAGAYYGRYSPDERFLAFTNPLDGAIYVRDLSTGVEIRVSPGLGQDCENCGLSH